VVGQCTLEDKYPRMYTNSCMKDTRGAWRENIWEWKLSWRRTWFEWKLPII